MTHILELSPVLSEIAATEGPLVQGLWNSSDRAAELALARGHHWSRPATGPVVDLDELLAPAQALVLAPTVATPNGMWLPADGEESGRLLGARLLDRLSEQRPDLHIVLVSHFLVGHGQTHRNSRTATWGLRAIEAHLRGGRNPWTVLRPTWLSTVHDESYRTRLTQDPNADGLVSAQAVATTVLDAIEFPEASAHRTAAIYNLSVPDGGEIPVRDQFAGLSVDLESTLEPAPSLAVTA